MSRMLSIPFEVNAQPIEVLINDPSEICQLMGSDETQALFPACFTVDSWEPQIKEPIIVYTDSLLYDGSPDSTHVNHVASQLVGMIVYGPVVLSSQEVDPTGRTKDLTEETITISKEYAAKRKLA